MNSLPINLSDLYSNYVDWVKRNPQTASEIESTIKWASYFVAGKISKSVVLTELVYSASNLLVLFNDLVLQSGLNKVERAGKKIKIWLSVLEYTEVFIEISSKRLWGEKGKWIIIICVQLLKCIGKLVLLFEYNEKIISCPAILPFKRPENDSKEERRYKNGNERNIAHSMAFCLRRSGRIVRKVESAPSLHNRLWKPPSYVSFSENDNMNESHPDKEVIQRHLIGEILFTIKPLLTLGTIMKCKSSAWKPWLLSAAADLISLYLLQTKPRVRPAKGQEFTSTQKLEMSRRRLALLLYLVRSPFYEKHSKNRIEAFLKGLSRNVPLARLVCQPIEQYIPHWQETYFYLWSS